MLLQQGNTLGLLKTEGILEREWCHNVITWYMYRLLIKIK